MMDKKIGRGKYKQEFLTMTIIAMVQLRIFRRDQRKDFFKLRSSTTLHMTHAY